MISNEKKISVFDLSLWFYYTKKPKLIHLLSSLIFSLEKRYHTSFSAWANLPFLKGSESLHICIKC